MFSTAYIALGSNLGDRRNNIRAALAALHDPPFVQVVRVSDLLQTAPVGPPGQGMYLNAAALLHTSLSARDLLDRCLAVEHSLGRTRDPSVRWTARTIDIDIMFFDDRVIEQPGLSVPHPRLHERVFMLRPLAQLAPDLVHPVLRKSVKIMLNALQTQGSEDNSPNPEYPKFHHCP